MRAGVIHAAVEDALPSLAGPFDACLCDSPYGLGFMGKDWDSPGRSFVQRRAVKGNDWDHVGGNHNPSNGRDRARTRACENRGFQEWCEAWASLVLPVMRPGAPLLAFGGTRTFHRLACAIEDAGFEIRDTLCWLYGSGFPKSLDVSKAIDKAAGAERVATGRVRAGHEEFASRTDAHSAGARREGWDRPWKADPAAVKAHHLETAPATPDAARFAGYGTALKPAWEPIILAMAPLAGTFAANAMEHGVAGLNVDGCRIEGAPRTTHADGNHRTSGSARSPAGGWRVAPHGATQAPAGRWPANVALDEEAARALDEQSGERGQQAPIRGTEASLPAKGDVAYGFNARVPFMGYGDKGGASRFFYTAKASTRERNLGLPEGATNRHPTVKPVALCEWLAKLILPPPREDGQPRRLLVPFSGSGSEMVGALRAGWDEVVGIEREAEHVEVARLRIAHELARVPPLFREAEREAVNA